jgi:hypothetical protein
MIDDDEFRTFVEKNRAFGYGRMMQLISELWREHDPAGALSVGDTYASCEQKRERCATLGHVVHSGAHYDWCDRGGDQLGPNTAGTPRRRP